MAASKSLKDLFKKLNGRINSALDNEVFEKVREVELEAIQTEVYDVYTPKVYIRRGEYGGIGDPYNIEKVGGAAKNGRLIVKNTTEPNDSNPNWTTDKILPELIEYGHSRYVRYRGGHGYDYPGGRYSKPRPFTAATIKNLRSGGLHVEAMKRGLLRQGLKVR